MARLLTIALLLAFPVFIVGLPVLWYRAEKKGELRKPVLTGILALAVSLALAVGFAVVFTVIFTQLDDQSYYAASVQTLLDETQAALDSGEPGFADRLRAFRESQRLTCETRADLLENARRFAEEGATIRGSAQ